MNNDYKIMQLINHGIYVITNEFDKILIIPCSLGHSASHENNNHVVLCHSWLPQTGERWRTQGCATWLGRAACCRGAAGRCWEQPGRPSSAGLARKCPQHFCSRAVPRNPLLTEPTTGATSLQSRGATWGSCPPRRPLQHWWQQHSPDPLLCFGAPTANGTSPGEAKALPDTLWSLWGCSPGLCLPRAGESAARLPPSPPPADIPWSSSLCCRYCSSSPRGRAAPCTPRRRGRAPSGTTTSAARRRLAERRASAPGCRGGQTPPGTARARSHPAEGPTLTHPPLEHPVFSHCPG